MKDGIQKLLPLGIKGMVEKKPKPAMSATAPLWDLVKTFPLSGKPKRSETEEKQDVPEAFNIKYEDLTPVLTILKGHCMEAAGAAQPTVGTEAWVTVATGLLTFLVLDYNSFCNNEWAIETLQGALEDEEFVQSISKEPIFGVPARNSIYIPFGTILVPVAIPHGDDEDANDFYCSSVTHYILTADARDVHESCEDVLFDMETAQTKSLKRRNNKFFNGEKTTDNMTAWMDTWKVKRNEDKGKDAIEEAGDESSAKVVG